MIFKTYKTKDKEITARVFTNTDFKTKKKRFTAAFIQIFGRVFWVWRNTYEYLNWPKAQ